MTLHGTTTGARPDEEAVRHFAARLRFETDVADVHAALEAGTPFLLLDSRGDDAWRQGRIPGAVHLPTRQIASRIGELPPDLEVVTYCWGPGCNGATRAALELARLGRPVREMLGGFEYWAREGFPVETDGGVTRGAADPLTAPRGVHCDC
ncbi:rhodanese-like domain-containing protein [Amnibacterium sp. CER49]|uniref:rhodanese-like domain-containing protein n=1 Tax=Amnibacterium sp. CER49 TaxID=3039161 RepID=UPI00244D6CC8|nr:rhodanese-like domain-containing protein [Amnibacterium sp. CER49]MDH2445170.1 rhodanese-like domain-containing protein [Amnibacterium sp. CER49]